MAKVKRFDQYRRVVDGFVQQGHLHLDANETALFARQLEDIDVRLFRKLYPELKGTLVVPVKSNINPGAQFYSYRVYDYAGRAKPISNYADDLPRVDLNAVEHKMALHSWGDAYGYSIQDLRAANMAGLPLENEKAMAARNVLAYELDDVIATGYAPLGITGLLNNPFVDDVSPDTGNWASATAEEMVADLVKMEVTIITESKGIEKPDTLLLASTHYAKLSTTNMANTETPALDYFLKRSQGVRNVEVWHKLETADVAGTGPRIVMYKRDPDKLEALVPVEFEVFPPQTKNLAFEVSCHMRAGGVVVRYPGSVRYMDGC